MIIIPIYWPLEKLKAFVDHAEIQRSLKLRAAYPNRKVMTQRVTNREPPAEKYCI